MGEYIKSILVLLFLNKKVHMLAENFVTGGELSASSFVVWPNATIPFYIEPQHFDREQSNAIMTTLALFAFKTCLKFVPALAPPSEGQHVLLFVNPSGVRNCVLNTDGHSLDQPHTVTLGYDCLRSPQIDMMVMKALGFPFEHNRASRELSIDVLFENVDPSAVELFTKDSKLPLELRSLAYDVDSVMHFGEREYSKNGHRTIIFKDHLHNPVKQNRNGLSSLDLRKIELVYGPECRKRDRQEKLEMCQNYPGAVRRKREIDNETNLRVNRDITPPPVQRASLNDSLKELGVEDEVQNVVDEVYKVSARALRNARAKYCNVSQPDLRMSEEKVLRNKTNPDLLGIIEAIADYAQSMVDNAVANLTQFCASSENIEMYQRISARCPYYGARDCPVSYRSTKSGPVKYSTQHRPVYFQSTKHDGNPYKYIGYHPLRDGNVTDGVATEATVSRKKREVDSTTVAVKATDAKGGRRDDDVTRVMNQRSKDDDDQRPDDVQSRRDDVTRIINPRSRDDEATTVGRRDDDEKSRKKRLVEGSPAPVNKDVTGANTKEDKATSPNANVTVTPNPTSKSGNSSSKNLRAGTVFPDKQRVVYEAEWPFPDRHRRINKLTKKIRSKTKYELDESKVSLERKMSSFEDSSRDTEITSRMKQKITRKMKRSKHRPQRQREISEPEDLVLANLGISDADQGKQHRSLPPITVPLSKANQEFYSERKWPDGVVRYVLKDNPNYDMMDVRRRLDEVNSILKSKTCSRIQEITESEAKSFTDYLVVDTSADFVTGRVGGRQNFGCLELFRGEQHRQHAAMIVMAMLGFYFELARHDRDKYVRVHLRHVRPDKLHHFEKIRADATFPLAYDFESATHPAWQFWRKVGKTGISTVATYKSRDPKGALMKSLGQHERLLSELDLVKINSVYGTKCFQEQPLRQGKKGKRGGPQQRTFH